MTSDLAGARRGAWLLVLAGCPGLLSLLLVLPEVPGVPPAALLVQPALLLLVSAVVGRWSAARCDLRLAAPARPAERVRQLAGGILLGFAIAAADHAARPLWQAGAGVPPSILEAWGVRALPVGLLYGGVVEEVVFRWGAMSLVALGLTRGLLRRPGEAPPRARTAAAVLAALLFAASHLPALAAEGELPGPAAVARTLLLNAIAGLVFGLLFARRDLLAAMLAHGGAHLGFAAAALAAGARA